jgi:GAF domain-containing protein/HAMP domain-containing protein
MMLTTLSVARTNTLEGVLLFIIALAAFIFMVPLKKKTTATLLLGTFFMCMALLGFTRILEGTVGGLLFVQLQDAFIILGGLFLIQFAYHFPEYDQPREARTVLIVYVLIVLLALGTIFVLGIDAYRNPEKIITSPEYYWYLMPLAIVLAVFLCLRRALYYAGHSREIAASWRARLAHSLKAILHPPNDRAASQRNLALAISLGAVQAIPSMGLVTGIWASYMIGIGGLLVVAGIALVYYSHTLEPISFVAKLVGISLTALLIFSGISGINSIERALAPQNESITRQFLAAQEAIVGNEESANAPSSLVSYIVSWPAPTGLKVGGARRFAGVQFRDFYRFRFGHDGRVYEIGFSWLEYAQPVLAEVNSHIFLTIVGTLFVLILFPFFFRRHLFNPLNNLLQGVRKADAGQTETSLPVYYEDEIGTITRSFNQMMASLRRSNNRRDQFHAELKKANEELMAEIAERKGAEATIERRLAIEYRLAEAAARLLAVPELEQAIQDTLQDVGQMVEAGRVGLVRFSALGDEPAMTYGWRRPGLEHLTDAVGAELDTTLDPLVDRLRAGETIYAEDAAQLVSGAGEAGAFFAEHGIDSLVVIPLQAHNQLLGALACTDFVDGQVDREEQIRILRVVAGLLGGLLQREALLEVLDQRVADRTAELSAFLDLTGLGSEAHSLPYLLGTALSRIAEIGRCDAVAIHVLSEDGRALRLIAQQGLADHEQKNQDLVDRDELQRLLDPAHNPFLTTLMAEAPALPPQLRPEGFHAYLGAQLQAGDRAIGILSCYRRSERLFALDRSSMLVALAKQLGIIVEHRRLRQQAAELAIAQERQRLSRELHDAVTQSLYSQTGLEGDAAAAAPVAAPAPGRGRPGAGAGAPVRAGRAPAGHPGQSPGSGRGSAIPTRRGGTLPRRRGGIEQQPETCPGQPGGGSPGGQRRDDDAGHRRQWIWF